jgi:O-antigen ligase
MNIIRLLIYLTLLCVPMWLRLPGAPPPFTVDYVAGFWIFVPMASAVGLWILRGAPGLRDLSPAQRWWALGLMTFALWACASPLWAFIAERRPVVTPGASMIPALGSLFGLVVLCIQPPVRQIAAVLSIGAVIHAIIGGLQVAIQRDIGLSLLGEFSLDPAQSGISVIQAGDIRWLRAYGLSAHPNIYAGYLVVGLLAMTPFLGTESRRIRWLTTGAFGFVLWVLFLTFSRGAWLAFVLGAITLIIRFYRLVTPTIRRHALITAGISIMLGLLFFARYQPLILVRAGVGQERLETRSIQDRQIYNDIALVAIQEHPALGVGSGNFPWFASHYLFYRTDSDRRGDNVHNIYLTVTSELGLIGITLFLVLVLGGLWLGRSADLTHGALGGGVIALLVIGFVDHYPVTFLHHAGLLWGLLALIPKMTIMDSKHTRL